MLQDIVHTFVGQAAPEAAQQLAGLSQDVEPGKREQKRDELIEKKVKKLEKQFEKIKNILKTMKNL